MLGNSQIHRVKWDFTLRQSLSEVLMWNVSSSILSSFFRGVSATPYNWLPTFLTTAELEIIARKGHEHVIIGIKLTLSWCNSS